MSRTDQTVETRDRELIITRIFDAPKELLFEVHSSCEHLKAWWGPRTYPVSYCKMDFRVGGEWHYCLKGPEGQESWGKSKYKEIVKPDRIAWEDHFSDSDGNINEQLPGMLVTITLEALDGKTKVVNHTLFNSPEDRDKIVEMGVIEGMSETLDRLDEHLEAIQKMA